MISARNIAFNSVHKVVSQKLYNHLPELVDILNNNKPLFVNILGNDPINSNDRISVLNSFKEGIQIAGIPQKVILSEDYIQESIIISDMFKLNEITSVELIMSGEAESNMNPDMTRGLIAVLNYYFSQKVIVDTLKLLLQAKFTINEESPASVAAADFIEEYLDKIFKDGLFSRIISVIKSMNIEEEVKLLESQRALGSARHRRQFFGIFHHIRKSLSECIMLRSYKFPLNKNDSRELINLLRDLYQDDVNIKREELIMDDCKTKKNVDHCFVFLLVGLMSSINPFLEGNSVSNYSKECVNHHFFTDDSYQISIDKILKDNVEKTSDYSSLDFENKSIIHNTDQVLYLSWIISLQKVSHLKKESNICLRSQRSTNFGDYGDNVELEMLHIDCQNIYECFQFLTKVISIEGFHEENIWVKCIHDLVTDFIIYMPKMLKDLRTESMRSKSNVLYFGSILELIGRLYGGANRLCEALEPHVNTMMESLVLEYWSPQEILNYPDSVTLLACEDSIKNWTVKSNDSYKQAVLFKFVRDSGDLVDNSQLFINYVFMLKGLCCSNRISLYIYSLLNNNQTSHHSSHLTWEWFSNTFQKYAKFLMLTPHKLHTMSPVELNGLLVVLQLIKRVTHHSKVVCASMISNESLMLAQNMIMLLSCRVPEILKAELLNCLSVFCINGLMAKSIWQALESNNIMARPSDPTSPSILVELDQIEPKSQEFFITRAFIRLLLAEVTHIVCDSTYMEHRVSSFDQNVLPANTQYASLDSFTHALHMVMDTVFLKHAIRTYKNIEEKFVVSETFLKLCCKCVDIFLAQVGNAKITKGRLSWCQYDPGFFVITQLLNDSLFFKTLVNIIENGFSQINDCFNNVAFGSNNISKEAIESLENSVYYAMCLLLTVLNKESFLIQLVRELNSNTKNDTSRSHLRTPRFRNFMPQELSHLLTSSSSTQNFFPNLIKYISIVDESERISRKVLSILNSCINMIEPHQNLMLMLTNKNAIDIDILPLFVTCLDKFGDIDPIFVQLLENQGISALFFDGQCPDSPRTLVLKMLISCLEKPAPNLGHFLMGFACESPYALKRTSLQEAGVGDCPKTCLHSLLNLINRLSSDILMSPCYDNAETPSDQLAALTINMMDLSLAFRILHILASDPNTSLFVLRFIRSNYQLIFSQMELLSFNTEKVIAIPELRALFWNQKSWLLRIIAIELRQCTANDQRSYVSKLLKFLFGDDFFEINNETVFSKLYTEDRDCQGLIYQMLEDMDISEPEEVIDFSSTKRFKPEILKEYLNQCFEESYMGLRLMNGDRLRQLIFADINLSLEEEQVLPLQQEIDAVCVGMAKYNTNEIWLMFGKNSFVDSWRQVVEVVMVTDCSGEDTIDAAIKIKKICDTLRLIMDKILVPSTPAALAIPLSRACLILTAVLGGLFVSSNHDSPLSSHIMPGDFVDTHAHKLSAHSFNEMESQLKVLVQLTTDCILKLNSQKQNTRIKFYGVLTYLIQIVLKMDSSRPDGSGLVDQCYAIISNSSSSFDSTPERCIYPTLCRDAVSSNIHLALSSLTLLDCIASVDKGCGGLIPYLVSNGYIQHSINSLASDCASMATNMTQAHGDSYADSSAMTIPYYLYQSKMSLFCKLATQTTGSRALVQCGVLSSLSRCDLFRARPQLQEHGMDCDDEATSDSEDVVTQHRHVLRLAVQLATSILTTQGLDKAETVREVRLFVSELIDVLCVPFQSSTSATSCHVTKEMIQISSLFAMLSSAVLRTECNQEEGHHFRILDKIKTASSQMLACLLGILNEPSHDEVGTMQYFLQIQLMNNLLSVISAIVSAGSTDANKLLFFSNNVDGVLGCRSNWTGVVKRVCQKIMSGDKAPLGLLVMTLFKVRECYSDMRQKIDSYMSPEVVAVKNSGNLNVSTRDLEQELLKLSTDQLQVLWSGIFEGGSSPVDSMDCARGDARKGLSSPKESLLRDLLITYQTLTATLTSLTASLESCCFLLWHHMLAYTSLSRVETAHDNGNLHPMQKLQLMERQSKQDNADMARFNSGPMTAVDVLAVLSKCVDEELLRNVQLFIEMQSGVEEAAFSKIIVHRLLRMLKFV